VYGISKLVTLVELNLNNNKISDILAIEELTNLEKLFLAHNKITDITPLTKCLRLQILDLTDNDIFHEESTMNTLQKLGKLKELSIGVNPVNAKEGFKYHLIVKLNLEFLEGDKISDLDVDIAKMYYIREGIDLPEPK
jgi:internalin A